MPRNAFDPKDYYLVLCQQAVEKALKALYIGKKKETPGATHSLIFLGVEIPERFRGALMSRDFVLTRYPDAAHCLPYEFYDEDITR